MLLVHVSSCREVRTSGDREACNRGDEERMMEIFILTILLLYIVLGCWAGDMVLVAGGAIGFVLVLGLRK